MSEAVNNPYSMDGLLRIMTAPNAGAHNAVYRGKYLGVEPTDAQYAAISAGAFNDLYIGDYWNKNGVNWRISAFNYFLRTGDVECTDNHVVVVPDTNLYNAAMNTTNVTTGAYAGSAMYTKNLAQAKNTIKSIFGDHILKHRIYLTNATSNGCASGSAWYDSEIDLMCERMVYGSGIFSPVSNGNSIPANHSVEKTQLPLFQHNAEMIGIGRSWWLRDVISVYYFSRVNGSGTAYYGGASDSSGVRPYFCIY